MASPTASSSPDGGRVGGVDVRRLRSAIEFALLVVGEARKTRPALSYPTALDRFVKQPRVSNAALDSVRRIIDADPDFRSRLGAVATADLVDDVGRLWLQRPEGWEEAIVAAAEAAAAADEEADLAAQLKRAEKRKAAAERTAARHAAELSGRDQRIAELEVALASERERVAELAADRDVAKADATKARLDARHANDRLAAVEQRLQRALSVPDVSETTADATSTGVSIDEPCHDDLDRAAVGSLASEVSELARRLAEIAGMEAGVGEGRVVGRDEGRRPISSPASARGLGADQGRGQSGRVGVRKRERLAMPPGVLSDSSDGTEFLLTSGAAIVVDGYNVTKQVWPGLSLIAQRDRLIDGVEQFAARVRGDVTVVFDGTDLAGGHAARRRSVRVVYSTGTETADDVIRAEVARLPNSRQVVVVTSDREIVRDVEALGANVVSSSRFIQALG